MTDLIDQSIAYCASLHAEIPSLLKGAAPEQIAEIESRMGRPLSPIYRAFLARMSEGPSSLDLIRFSTSAAEILLHKGDALKHLPAGVELFAAGFGDAEADLLLVHEGDREARIIAHPKIGAATTALAMDEAETFAGSLPELICLSALNRWYCPTQPLQSSFVDESAREGGVARAAELADWLAFKPTWFSSPRSTPEAAADATLYVGLRDGMVLIARQLPGWDLSVGLAGSDEYGWALLSRTLVSELGLSPYR
jgi:hypothetical protein